MHQDTIEQLDKTIAEVFSLMLNRDCNPALSCSGPASIQAGHSRPGPPPHAGVTASISFSGSMRGACSIHLPLRTAAAISVELVGPLSEDAAITLSADTAGEICNMIAGSWKSRQADPHATCALSPPKVATADLHVSPPPPLSPGSHVSFRHTLARIYQFEDHCLHLELGFD